MPPLTSEIPLVKAKRNRKGFSGDGQRFRGGQKRVG